MDCIVDGASMCLSCMLCRLCSLFQDVFNENYSLEEANRNVVAEMFADLKKVIAGKMYVQLSSFPSANLNGNKFEVCNHICAKEIKFYSRNNLNYSYPFFK